jgi:hypothetical protein
LEFLEKSISVGWPQLRVTYPVLPAYDAAFQREGYALGLCDVNGLEVLAETAFGFDGSGMVVVGWCLVQGSSDRRNVDMDDFLGIRVEDGTEVEGIGVLAVVDMRAVIHESLLEANIASKAFIVANRPG